MADAQLARHSLRVAEQDGRRLARHSLRVAGQDGRRLARQSLRVAFGQLPSPDVAVAVAFTSLSTDSDGTVVAHAWEFGDGATSTEVNPIHTYPRAQLYSVTLTVTDNEGATDSVSHDVSVVAPSAGFGRGPFGRMAFGR